jgi:hypothetical protein
MLYTYTLPQKISGKQSSLAGVLRPVHHWFRRVSCQIGLRQATDRQGPRLHALRHRFVITTLRHWYQIGEDVEAHLPDLTSHIGHGHVNDTYWYISATPELLQLATERLEGKKGGSRS